MHIDTALRVTRLEAKDFKRIESLDVCPGRKSLVILRGPNEAGKTSAIDSLIAAIGGRGRSPEVPIRRGAEDAVVTVELSDALRPRYQVTRSWTGEKSYLHVKAVQEDGTLAKLTAGQTLLDSLVSDVSFDPLAFAKATKAEQVRLLYAAVGKLGDYNAAQARRKELYDQRTEINGRGRQAEAELAACPDPAPGQVLQPVSDAQLAKQLADAQAHNAMRASVAREAESHDKASREHSKRAEQLDEQIARLRQEAIHAAKMGMEMAEQAKATSARLAAMPPAVDTAAITAHVQQVREANRRAEQQAAHRAKRQAAEQARQESAGLTAQIEAVDRDLDRMLETSGIGQAVPGLAVREGEVLHNALPLSQASGMRRLEVSCLVGMAASPSLRVLCVDEGDQLDDAAIARLIELAQARDYAVWMTAIRAGDPANPETHVVDIAAGKASVGSQTANRAPAAAGGNPTCSVAPAPAGTDPVFDL